MNSVRPAWTERQDTIDWHMRVNRLSFRLPAVLPANPADGFGNFDASINLLFYLDKASKTSSERHGHAGGDIVFSPTDRTSVHSTLRPLGNRIPAKSVVRSTNRTLGNFPGV